MTTLFSNVRNFRIRYRTQGPKLRTYRQKARRINLNIAKQKQPRSKSVRKAIGKQLRYIARNLRIIQSLQKQAGATELTQRQQQYVETTRTLYAQQRQPSSAPCAAHR